MMGTMNTSSLTAADRAATLNLAVIGAGPVGLALALHAARRLSQASITVYDRWPASHDLRADRRTLALAQGSVQFLERLGVWAAIEPEAASIQHVHVSQQQPGLLELLGRPSPAEVRIDAQDLGVPQLGAVAAYGAIVAPMREAWLQACAAAAPAGALGLRGALGRCRVGLDGDGSDPARGHRAGPWRA